MQASVDDDDQLIDRPLVVLNAFFYMLDTGCLFGFIHQRVVYMYQGIVYASFS